jgi:hypothetical protein
MVLSLLVGSCGSLPLRERVGLPIAILVLLVFAGVGIDSVVHPARHMNAYQKRGGDMLRDLGEMQVQLGGVVFTAIVAWALYQLAQSIWSKCFG